MTSKPTPTEEELKLAQELIAQLQDPEWTLAAAQLEDEVGGEVGAGYVKNHQLGKFFVRPSWILRASAAEDDRVLGSTPITYGLQFRGGVTCCLC